MAWGTATGRGSAVTEVAGTSLAMNPSANLTVNMVVFVTVVTDNVATVKGESNNHTAVADNTGGSNLWRKITEYTETDGSAADGVTVSVWGARIVTQIATTNTITATTSSATCRIISAVSFSVTAGSTFTVDQIGIGQSSLTATTSGLSNSARLYLYAAGAEGTDLSKTPSAGWSELIDVRSGSGTSIATHVCSLITTSTGQSATSTAWTNTNPMSLQIALSETVGSPSVSPSASPSQSPSASVSPSASPSASPSQSPSASVSPSISPSASPSQSPSASISPSISPSASPSQSPSASVSPSISPSVSPSKSPSISPSIASPAMSSLSDNFNDNSFDTAKWESLAAVGGQTKEEGQLLKFVPLPNQFFSMAGIVSGTAATPKDYDLTSDSAHIKVPQLAAGGSDVTTRFDLIEIDHVADRASYLEFIYNPGTGNLSWNQVRDNVPTAGSGSVTYNATNHLWWRIRESGGAIYWDTSADGTNWDNLHNETAVINYRELYVYILTLSGSSWPAPGETWIDNFNTPPASASPSASPSQSPSASISPSISPSASPSQSPSASTSPSESPSVSPSASPSTSPSVSPSSSISPSISPSILQSFSPSVSPSVLSSVSPSASPSSSVFSVSPSISPSIAATELKTINDLNETLIKTVNGTPRASIKKVNGVNWNG